MAAGVLVDALRDPLQILQPRVNGMYDGDVDDGEGDDEADDSGETTPVLPTLIPTPSNGASAGSATAGSSSSPSFYSAMPVQGKDPLSGRQPLRAFDRTAFEAAFPRSSTSTSTSDLTSLGDTTTSASATGTSSSSASSVSANSPRAELEEKDPFFYPLLCENERRRLHEFWRLTFAIHDDQALASYLQNLLSIVKDLYDFDVAVIQLIDNDRSSSIDMNGWQETCCPRRETACAHTMLLQPGTILTVSDFMKDARFANNKRLVEGQVRSYAGAPLAYSDNGESISLGSLCVFSFVNQKPPLSPLERESLCRFADLAMHAIKDRSRLRRESIQTRRHEILSRISKTVGPPSHVVESTLAALTSTLGGRASFIKTHDGCIPLRNAGRVPVCEFEGGLYENADAVEEFIKYHNHESSLDYDPKCTVRAIAVPLTNVSNHYLVVETDQLRNVYDGTDTLFVQSCAMVIGSSIQDGLLRKALEAKTTFLRNAQHAFRTSLNGILSATDMLLGESHVHTDNEIDLVRRSVLNGKTEETSPLDLLRIIETSGRGLLTVINHLIDLDAQSTKVNRELCDLHDIEEEVLDSIVQHSSKEKMKDLLLVSDSHLDGATGDCVVSDRLLLRQTIAALVQNAVEATSGAGMVMVKVSLSGVPGVDQTLDVEVRDTGVGIADADRERIFQPFEKVNTFTPNAGLGLSFACQYAASLGGTVTLVQSAQGVGSVFLLRLPNPVLASSLQMRKTRSKLPQSWSYCMEQGLDRYEAEAVYGAALQRLGVRLASSLSAASIAIHPMSTLSNLHLNSSHLQPHQVHLMLGWEEDYHRKATEQNGTYKIVYGRLPWTRNRLIATILQAQKIANKVETGADLYTPPHELANLSLTPAEAPSEVRALLVDDNAMNLSILQAYCRKRKYDYQSARDGKEAFRVYVAACEADAAPTICLLDLQMPICDGMACTRMIRAYERRENRARCPIIMVTAQSGDLDRQGALDAGTDAYYVKPLRVSTLDDIVARYART